jgi:hypothetical protein
MATGEVIGAEELGGAKVHAVTTGLALAPPSSSAPMTSPVAIFTRGGPPR